MKMKNEKTMDHSAPSTPKPTGGCVVEESGGFQHDTPYPLDSSSYRGDMEKGYDMPKAASGNAGGYKGGGAKDRKRGYSEGRKGSGGMDY